MNLLEQLGLIMLVAISPLWPGALGSATPTRTEPAPTVQMQPSDPWPIRQEEAVAPVVNAKSALVVDLPSSAELYSKDADQPLPIASLTKLMTALLVVEKLPADRVVTVPEGVAVSVDESRMSLQVGDQLTADDLLAGLLIASANDAAKALAREVAGSEQEFVKLMNQRAEELGLSDTQFFNPSGFSPGSEENYSTARELAVLSRAAIAEPRIRNWVHLKEHTVAARNLPAPLPGQPPADKPNEYKLFTTDQLIGGYLPIAGLKTGTSDAAGPCLVSLLSSGDRNLLAIVLNSPQRFQENKSMLDWSLRAYTW